ncbi:hypothetical protein P8452_54955 [Trifolium repens]|jgi:hypothetical protein|nr:hypothetical protein P8452_54955 [Trifolium repens]
MGARRYSMQCLIPPNSRNFIIAVQHANKGFTVRFELDTAKAILVSKLDGVTNAEKTFCSQKIFKPFPLPSYYRENFSSIVTNDRSQSPGTTMT